ncbi:MAG: hypothetical protein WCO56_20605 [Verrucomicrobiota bacterium]
MTMKIKQAWMKTGLAFVGLLFSAAAVYGQSNYYWFFLVSQTQRLDVMVNGFPWQELSGTNSMSSTAILDPFLVRGSNNFQFRFTDDTNQLVGQSLLARLRLEYGDTNGGGRTRFFEMSRTAEWVSGIVTENTDVFCGSNLQYFVRGKLNGVSSLHQVDSSASRFEYRYLTNGDPNTIILPMTLSNAPGTNLPWAGVSVALTPADITSITTLVSSVQTALVARDYTTMMTLLHAKILRVAAANGTAVADEETKLRNFYTDLVSGDFAWDPLDTTKLEFKSYDTANLVRVHIQNLPPITGHATGYRLKIPIYVSKVAGSWIIVE